MSWARAIWSQGGPDGASESNGDAATATGKVIPGVHPAPHLVWFDDEATRR